MKPLIFLLAVALAGCAGAPFTGAQSGEFFADNLFKPLAAPVDRDAVVAISPAMHRYLLQHIPARGGVTAMREALMTALQRDIRLEYDSERTRTASEAFEARSGNCLSLVLMTAAFARELGIPFAYQTVYGEDTWTRTRGMVFHSGHINLLLGTAVSGEIAGTRLANELVVDFLPASEIARHVARPIGENTVVAMYLNNRAAELLADGDADGAYWRAREAMKTAPAFLSAYNTLGVVYRRHGDLPQAERVLRHVLDRDRENPQVLSNLADVLAAEGKDAESRELQARLGAIEPYPPFFYLDQGTQALQRGDAEGALALFRKELARMPYDDEVQFAMAVASLRLGQVPRARRYLVSAEENSTTRERRNIYAAKLEYLKAIQ